MQNFEKRTKDLLQIAPGMRIAPRVVAAQRSSQTYVIADEKHLKLVVEGPRKAQIQQARAASHNMTGDVFALAIRGAAASAIALCRPTNGGAGERLISGMHSQGVQ